MTDNFARASIITFSGFAVKNEKRPHHTWKVLLHFEGVSTCLRATHRQARRSSIRPWPTWRLAAILIAAGGFLPGMVIPETTSSRPKTGVQEKQAADFWL
jgi:hypothetical protein